MDAAGLLFAVVLVLVLVSVASHRYRVPPFFALVGGALLFGLLAGLGVDRTVEEIVAGIGRVFGAFGIILFSGAVIAKALEAGGGVAGIAADVRRHVRDPVAASGLLGYLLAVPLTCCITAFVLLVPVLSAMDSSVRRTKGLLYLAALGSVTSYALVYPTPVVIPLVQAFDASSSLVRYNAVAIPLSLLVLLLLVLAARRRLGPASPAPTPAARDRLHLRAWAPFAVILAAVGAGFAAGLSHIALINLVMLAGAATALALASSAHRRPAVLDGAKHAGVIVFDLVGAGALGSVMVAGGVAEEALGMLAATVPVLLVPFLVAALVQTMQGSRVVTAVIAGDLLAGTEVAAAIDPVPLVLMVGAGACVISYVTDPYFWLVHRATGDSPSTVTREYTLPLAAVGFLVLGAALAVQVLF